MTFLSAAHGIFGIVVLLGIAWIFSNNRTRVNWRLVTTGLLIQITFGILVIKGRELAEIFTPLGWPKELFGIIAKGFVIVLGFTTEGARFIFGNLALSPGTSD
ncbi:MAG: NupC/NupG family nucleoside CNT transporter, partial [Ignavibacteriales bacterium]|nr:NupC/NupG family nucleoside CNT transporter [Ignavibacteriales bacterium]